MNRVRLAVVTMRPGFFPSASAFTYFPAAARSFVDLRHFSFDDPELIEKLNSFRPNAITGYASLLTTLSARASELRLAPDLIQITNISEGLSERRRKQVQAAFNVPILDSYAMGECPFLSNGCPTHGGAHVNSDWAILEVVDENYHPVPPGVTGTKVLLTNLANRVQPIIRYKIGDLVEMANQPCDCGSALPRIAQIGGRAAEALWLWDGVTHQRIALGVFKCACEYLHEVREWQVVQTDQARIEVRLELLPGAMLNQSQAASILEERLSFFGLPAGTGVDVRIVDRLKPDSASGKMRHLIGIDTRSAASEPSRERNSYAGVS
jgi:phenylacetate-coenzyme A ligase PaaK-like adenylate-forming protein